MKRNSIYLCGSIVLLCCSSVFFFVSRSPTEKLMNNNKTYTELNKKGSPTARDSTGNSTDSAPSLVIQESADSLSSTSKVREKEVARLLDISDSSEYKAFAETYTKEIRDTYNETGVFDVSFQDFFDFFETQGMPRVDVAEEALEYFREYFPSGVPEDYDFEMAARFVEAFSTATGTRNEASAAAFFSLSEEPDFTAWMLGRFKGDLGRQLQWIDEQSAIATALQDSQFELSIDGQLPVPVETSINRVKGSSELKTEFVSPLNTESMSEGENTRPTPLSQEQIPDLRLPLKPEVTDNWIIRLLENEPDLFRRFFDPLDSLDRRDAWRTIPVEERLRWIQQKRLPSLNNRRPPHEASTPNKP